MSVPRGVLDLAQNDIEAQIQANQLRAGIEQRRTDWRGRGHDLGAPFSPWLDAFNLAWIGETGGRVVRLRPNK